MWCFVQLQNSTGLMLPMITDFQLKDGGGDTFIEQFRMGQHIFTNDELKLQDDQTTGYNKTTSHLRGSSSSCSLLQSQYRLCASPFLYRILLTLSTCILYGDRTQPFRRNRLQTS